MPHNKRKHKNQKKHPPSNPHHVTKPIPNCMCEIPNPLPIRQEVTAEDKKRYSDESNDRAAQLRSDRTLNRITGVGVAVAVLTLFGLILSIQQSRRSMELDQRAWVVPIVVCGKIPNEPGPRIASGDCIEPKVDETRNNAVVYFMNFGKTPALNVHAHSQWAESVEKVPAKDVAGDKPSVSVLSPTGVENIHPDLSDSLVDRIQTQGKGKIAGVVFGTIWYTDIFGRSHWTRYCYEIFDIFSAYMPCEKYNTTDDE